MLLLFTFQSFGSSRLTTVQQETQESRQSENRESGKGSLTTNKRMREAWAEGRRDAMIRKRGSYHVEGMGG